MSNQKYSITRIIHLGSQEQWQTIPEAVNNLALWQITDVHPVERGAGGRGSETVFRLSFLSDVRSFPNWTCATVRRCGEGQRRDCFTVAKKLIMIGVEYFVLMGRCYYDGIQIGRWPLMVRVQGKMKAML